ncbi:MAG: FMN-binding protein [Pirellulaceae bacterium]
MTGRAKWLQALRIAFLCTVILLIYSQHQCYLKGVESLRQAEDLLPQIQQILPAAETLTVVHWNDGTPALAIQDAAEKELGFCVRTQPAAEHIVGFSGPTDVLLLLDSELHVTHAEILHSGDTRDHVQQVIRAKFLEQLHGRTTSQMQSFDEIDGVSGATLTTAAILESIRFRLNNGIEQDSPASMPSLKFPDGPQIEDLCRLYPTAAAVEPVSYSSLWTVLDKESQPLGRVLRLSPAADNVIGYQGPTDALIGLGEQDDILGLSIGASYDNEPYVEYVRTDRYFLRVFNQRTLPEVAEMDLQAEGIEGVSGATMTSSAVAQGVLLAAKNHVERNANPSEHLSTEAIGPLADWLSTLATPRNLSTIMIVGLGTALGLSHWKPWHQVRFFYQCLLIGWLGWVNGDMLSQAMFVGWAQNGLPRGAPGLLVLTVVAFVIPIGTGKNLYCAQLCPHGAVQQLVRNRLPWRVRISPRAERGLRWIPMALLGWVLLVALRHLPFSLVDIEPFDAWVWTIAGAAALTIAIVGLVCSLFVPMAYCRYGCPTGKLLEYVRYSKHGHWTKRDTAGLILLGLAIALVCL